MIAEILTTQPEDPFELVNRLLRKQEISQLIDEVYRHCGQKGDRAVRRCDHGTGFPRSLQGRHSFGKDDMVVPDSKTKLIDETRHRVRGCEQRYQDGLTTDKEKYNLVVDTWSKCTDLVAAEMMKEIAIRENRSGNGPRHGDQLHLHDEPFRCCAVRRSR